MMETPMVDKARPGTFLNPSNRTNLALAPEDEEDEEEDMYDDDGGDLYSPGAASPYVVSKAASSRRRLDYNALAFGERGTLRQRVIFLSANDELISPWHHVPLHHLPGVFRFVCTTPAGSWRKMELAHDEDFSPLKLTSRASDGQQPSRFSSNCPWNLGLLPQTWNDPEQFSEQYGGLPGDGGPLQALDVGGSVAARTGQVYSVKPLAAFALLQPQVPALTWRILVVASTDPMAAIVSDLSDLNKWMPGRVAQVREWLRTCDCIEGDRPAVFGLHERPLDGAATRELIFGLHSHWRQLIEREPPPDPWQVSQTANVSAPFLEKMWSRHTAGASSSEAVPVGEGMAIGEGEEEEEEVGEEVDEEEAGALPAEGSHDNTGKGRTVASGAELSREGERTEGECAVVGFPGPAPSLLPHAKPRSALRTALSLSSRGKGEEVAAGSSEDFEQPQLFRSSSSGSARGGRVERMRGEEDGKAGHSSDSEVASKSNLAAAARRAVLAARKPAADFGQGPKSAALGDASGGGSPSKYSSEQVPTSSSSSPSGSPLLVPKARRCATVPQRGTVAHHSYSASADGAVEVHPAPLGGSPDGSPQTTAGVPANLKRVPSPQPRAVGGRANRNVPSAGLSAAAAAGGKAAASESSSSSTGSSSERGLRPLQKLQRRRQQQQQAARGNQAAGPEAGSSGSSGELSHRQEENLYGKQEALLAEEAQVASEAMGGLLVSPRVSGGGTADEGDEEDDDDDGEDLYDLGLEEDEVEEVGEGVRGGGDLAGSYTPPSPPLQQGQPHQQQQHQQQQQQQLYQQHPQVPVKQVRRKQARPPSPQQQQLPPRPSGLPSPSPYSGGSPGPSPYSALPPYPGPGPNGYVIAPVLRPGPSPGGRPLPPLYRSGSLTGSPVKSILSKGSDTSSMSSGSGSSGDSSNSNGPLSRTKSLGRRVSFKSTVDVIVFT